jgi:hypothetical protein
MKAFVENVELWVAREDEAFKVACEAYGPLGFDLQRDGRRFSLSYHGKHLTSGSWLDVKKRLDRHTTQQIAEPPEQVATVSVRRQWNDWKIAQYKLKDIGRLHWSNLSGGINATAPQLFVHGYVLCDQMIDGELSHSCRHGPPPHLVKVCITKKGNEAIWPKILEIVGPKPEWVASRSTSASSPA